jgi:Zn-dependent protease with chaperone function
LIVNAVWPQRQRLSTLVGLAALLASILWRSAFFAGGGQDDNGGSQLALVMFAAGLLLAVVGFIIGPLIRLALSRERESLADVSGVELTRNPAGLISALKKLQQNDKPFKKMNHATAAMCIDDPLQHHESWYHRLYDRRRGGVRSPRRDVDRGRGYHAERWHLVHRPAPPGRDLPAARPGDLAAQPAA